MTVSSKAVATSDDGRRQLGDLQIREDPNVLDLPLVTAPKR